MSTLDLLVNQVCVAAPGQYRVVGCGPKPNQFSQSEDYASKAEALEIAAEFNEELPLQEDALHYCVFDDRGKKVMPK